MTYLADTVQVVTSGVDWPAVVAAVSGGVVGLAGIIAAWQQSVRMIWAEDSRGRIAEKRRVYASYLAALMECFQATVLVNELPGPDAKPIRPETHAEILRRAYAAQASAGNAFYEVQLVGSAKVVTSAAEILGLIGDGDDPLDADAWGQAHGRLISAMRSDLEDSRQSSSRRSIFKGKQRS